MEGDPRCYVGGGGVASSPARASGAQPMMRHSAFFQKG